MLLASSVSTMKNLSHFPSMFMCDPITLLHLDAYDDDVTFKTLSIPPPPFSRNGSARRNDEHSRIPSPAYRPRIANTRLRSLSFSAIEEYLSLSFRCVAPIVGAPSLWEKTKYQDVANGVDSMIVVLRRNAKHLASKLGRGERTRRSSRSSKDFAEEIGADSISSSPPFHRRAGSLPPFVEEQAENKEEVLHVSSAEEPPSPMDATHTLPFHVEHLAW
jgi:hypothetical protein